ncbi:MAG: hypothetical protein AB7O49_13985 [Sphingomonadales bacterium]
MTLPATSPIPVVRILAEVGRLHWQHALVFLAAAALYAFPVTMILSPLADTLMGLQSQHMPTPEQMERLGSQGLLAALVIPVLTAALFWFWVRLTLMGPRAGWRHEGAGRSILAVLQLAGLMVLALIAAAIGVFPLTLLLGLLGQSTVVQFLTFLVISFGTCLAYAVLSRRLVETALELPRTSAPPAVAGFEPHLRLAALFTAVTFGLFLVQSIVTMALTGANATLSVKVATGILSTATMTIYASIHAIVYRMRTVPPRQPMAGS